MGRPRLQFSEEQRLLVKSMAAYGIKHEDIGKLLNIKSPKTLRRHFRQELDRGSIEALARVAQTGFKMATSGHHPDMTKFWLLRSGWHNRVTEPSSSAPFIVARETEAK